MRFGSGPSWQVREGDPDDLFFALYIRDALGIVAADDFPPIAPPVATWVPDDEFSISLNAVTGSWRAWWTTLISGRAAPGGALLDAPDFESTDDAQLREAQRALLRRALEWRREHPSPSRATLGRAPSPMLITHLVQDIERTLGRKAAPFVYTIETVPTRGRRYWDLSPTALLVSEVLLADDDAFRDVLRPRLTALA